MDPKTLSEPAPAVDMSPQAIGRRLRELGQLYELGMSLQKARKLGRLSLEPTSPDGAGLRDIPEREL